MPLGPKTTWQKVTSDNPESKNGCESSRAGMCNRAPCKELGEKGSPSPKAQKNLLRQVVQG